jgi:hypothetical protein
MDQYAVQPTELPSSYYPAQESFSSAPPLRYDNLGYSAHNFLTKMNTGRASNLDLNQGIGVDIDFAQRTLQNMDREYGFQADGSTPGRTLRRDVGQFLPEVSLQNQLQQEVLRMTHQSPTGRRISSGNMGNVDPRIWHFPISQSKANSVTNLNSDGRASILENIPRNDILYGRNKASASTNFYGENPIVGGAELRLPNRIEPFIQQYKGTKEGCGCGCGCGVKYAGECKCKCEVCQKKRLSAKKERFLDGEENDILNIFEEKNIMKLFIVLIFVAVVMQYCEIIKLNGLIKELMRKHVAEPINPITEASASDASS